MMYSVYDYSRRLYDYYDAPGPTGTHASSPPMPRTGPSSVGASPERASWRLPVGARRVGSGEMPKGRIASLSGSDLTSDPVRILTLVALGYATWRILR